jgi:intracellular sulfur oxidation DsrE/DsrF family protein
MKMKWIFFTALLIVAYSGLSQTKPVQIVFDVTSKDTLTHQAVLRHVVGMAKAYPQSKFEVVIYGGSLDMVTKGKSSVAKSVEDLSTNKNVSFKVCAVTMKRYGVGEGQLLTGVQVVPDGILEIVNRQSEGWGYIKEAHN